MPIYTTTDGAQCCLLTAYRPPTWMCRILGAKRGLRNPILLQSAERWIWEHCHCTVHQVCRQIVASCNGFNGPGGIAEQGTEIRSGIRLSRQLAAAHAMRPSSRAPRVGVGRLASARVQDGGGLARSPRSACAGAPCAFWLAQRRYARAGHACAPAGWPPARRAASLTRDGSGGCRCRPDGILDRWLSVAAARRAWRLLGGLRRMGRRVVVEVPYLHRWFAVDPVQDFGRAFKQDVWTARAHGYALLRIL